MYVANDDDDDTELANGHVRWEERKRRLSGVSIQNERSGRDL